MSEQNDLSHYIPRKLDDPDKFLFWEWDVAGIFVVGMVLGILSEYPVTGLVAGGVMAYRYNKLKAGKHPGMAIHIFYWFLGFPKPKVLPPSHIRELNG